MLTDKELADLALPIISIFNVLELELIEEITERFDRYDKMGGSLEWQSRMLEEMGVLNQALIRAIARETKRTESELTKMLQAAAMANFSEEEIRKAYEIGVIGVTYESIQNSTVLKRIVQETKIETGKTIKFIETKALESAKQSYMDVINKSYIEVTSGVRSYSDSVNRALKEMAKKGITGATYQREYADGRVAIVHYSLEGTIRRDMVTAANTLATKVMLTESKEAGYNHVEVSQHLGARIGSGLEDHTNHAWWQGKVYRIEGSDDEYPNLAETTGYGLVDGLSGANCRHRVYMFLPGVSKPHEPVSAEKNEEVEKANKKLRAMERDIRALRKQYAVVKKIGTQEEKKEAREAILEQSERIDRFCSTHNLKRQFAREIVNEL